MGMSYAKGLIHSQGNISFPIYIFDKDSSKTEELRETEVFQVVSDINGISRNIDLVLLAVKPQQFMELASGLYGNLNPKAVAISIMAGVEIAQIQSSLGLKKVSRAMPNLPAQIKLGITGVFHADAVSEKEKQVIHAILEATGCVISVPTEDHINKVTAISGSGPAYVFYFMQAMEKTAGDFGFSEQEAKLLVTSTFLGAEALYRENDWSNDEWISRVSSKGGTTAAAIEKMKSLQVSEHIQEGVKAAYQRALELGKR